MRGRHGRHDRASRGTSRGPNGTIVFVADSEDGRFVIRQEHDGQRGKDVGAITLADPGELRTFFKGLGRILASLGHTMDVGEPTAARGDPSRALARAHRRSPRAVELRLRRFGALPAEDERRVG